MSRRRADAERTAVLSRALKMWPVLARSCRRRGESGGLALYVTRFANGTMVAHADLDRCTGLKILKVARRVIEDELRKMGGEP